MIRTKIFLPLLLLCLLVAVSSSAQTLYPLKGVTILLDPGHGGTDSGAIGPTGLKESETNLRVARYLRTLLIADGAEVFMTREQDTYLSLGERVDFAKKYKPDLFVSIHHNASLKPISKNKSEIYYNAMDTGLSQAIGKNMISELEAYGFGEESIIVPAGFFVLRNNPSPSVLSEASYISIPAIEKQLKTGKALTNQAEALRRAIKETFSNGPLKINVIMSESPVKIDTQFFNFIFTANKPISEVHARLSGDAQTGFGFDKLPSMSSSYRIYNTQPMKSGEFELQLTFYAKDGSVAPRVIIPLSVNLPFATSRISPISPYIPEGFKGKFPILINMLDASGSFNERSAAIALFYKETSQTIGVSSKTGKTVMYIDLDGNEKSPLEIRLVHDSEILATAEIPIKPPIKRFVLGQVVTPTGEGLEGVVIKYGLHTIETTVDGLFYAEYPMMYDNLRLELNPPLGYQKIQKWLKTKGEPVSLKKYILQPVSAALLGKKIGIIAPLSFDNLLRKLVKELMLAGAKITRLPLPEVQSHPEYQAVLEANTQNDFDLIISFKRELGGVMNARHYHRGGKGKLLADSLAFSLKTAKPPINLLVQAGSDYEISHTGATAVVIAFPPMLPPDYPEKLILHLAQVLKTGF